MTEQLELPVKSWDEGSFLRKKDGGRLRRWGSVEEAGTILFGVGKDKIYAMIRDGDVRAAKIGTSKNSHWRVDLVSVWECKVRMQDACRLGD